MTQPVLTDKSKMPDDKLIFSIIGKYGVLWEKWLGRVRADFPDVQGEWRYYNDGKSWLYKMTRKAKTVVWIGVTEETFRTTFYFPDRAEPVIAGSSLPDNLKLEFKNAKKYGKTRGLTITMKTNRDVENAVELLKLKLSIKP
jgi:hypothetical protein